MFGALYLVTARWLPQDASNLTAGWGEAISLDMLRRNIVYCFFLPSLAMGGGWFGVIVYVVTLPFAIAAAVRNLRREGHLIAYVALTMGLYVLLPFSNQGARYAYPILPVLFYLVMRGMSGESGRIRRIATITVLGGLLALSLWSSAEAAYLNLRNDRAIDGPFDPVSRAMFDNISGSTEPDSVIIFFKPRVMTLMTGRRAIMVYRDEQLERGDYLVYDREFNLEQVSDSTVQALLAAGVLNPRYENARFVVFKIENRGAGTSPAGPGA